MEHVRCTEVCVCELWEPTAIGVSPREQRLTLGPGRFIPMGAAALQAGWSVVTCCKAPAGARLTPGWGWTAKVHARHGGGSQTSPDFRTGPLALGTASAPATPSGRTWGGKHGSKESHLAVTASSERPCVWRRFQEPHRQLPGMG